MSADALIARLHGVRRNGPNRWLARCPAHEDRSPSLSIREEPDGRVLVRCFAGCGFTEIVEAAGVDMAELFPPNTGKDRLPAVRWPAADVLAALTHESLVLLMQAKSMARGEKPNVARLLKAAERFQRGLDAAHGR